MPKTGPFYDFSAEQWGAVRETHRRFCETRDLGRPLFPRSGAMATSDFSEADRPTDRQHLGLGAAGMTTNRTPIARPVLTMISPRAVALFAAMGRLHCTCPPPSPTRELCPGCDRWWDLQAELVDELGSCLTFGP